MTFCNIIVCCMAGFCQEVITLKTAIKRTLDNNISIRQAEIDEAIGLVDLQQAKNNLLPGFNANTQGGYYFGRSQIAGLFSYTSSTSLNINGNAQMEITVYRGGQLRNQIVQNKLALAATKGVTDKIKNDLVLNVVTVYLQILTNDALFNVAKQQLHLAEQVLKRAKVNFELGNLNKADLAQSKVQVSSALLQLKTAENQREMSLLILKQLMETNPYESIQVQKPDTANLAGIKSEFNTDEVVRKALEENPDIRLSELQEKTFKQAIKVEKSNYYPRVSFYGGLSSSYSNRLDQKLIGQQTVPLQIGTVQYSNEAVFSNVNQPIYTTYGAFDQIADNFNQNIGLSIQIPIFNRFTSRNGLRRSELLYRNAQLNTITSKNNLTKTVIQGLTDLKSASDQSLLAAQMFEATKEALNVMQKRYDAGLINSLDYNTAITNYNRSENEMIEAKYRVLFRSKIIEYYLGVEITL